MIFFQEDFLNLLSFFLFILPFFFYVKDFEITATSSSSSHASEGLQLPLKQLQSPPVVGMGKISDVGILNGFCLVWML